MNTHALRRTLSYLSHYRVLAALPYVFLLVATLAQLMVPRMGGNMIDDHAARLLAIVLGLEHPRDPRIDLKPAQYEPGRLISISTMNAC
jgi:hypothetical protein